MTEEMIEKDENRVYEVGYLLLPSIPEEQVSNHVSTIKKLIEGAGGEFISLEDPKLRHLSYEMKKLVGTSNTAFRSAYFGWVKFEMPAEGALNLKVELDKNENILRYLLIKTVRESTYVPRVAVRGEDATVADSSETTTPLPVVAEAHVVAEDLDKSIDALVAGE
jgi:ribosomal protein S6